MNFVVRYRWIIVFLVFLIISCKQDNPILDETFKVERTLLLTPEEGNKRNSEGDFVWLDDGRLLFIYAYFTKGSRETNPAYLVSRVSADSGRTWSDKDSVISTPNGRIFTKTVNLLRLQNGSIALFYPDDGIKMRISNDETETWGNAVSCTNSNDTTFYQLINDRVVQLKNGRIIIPVVQNQKTSEMCKMGSLLLSHIVCFYSDDNGHTWMQSKPVSNPNHIVLQEPGVVELSDGQLMMYCRTNVGVQYESFSTDDGELWSVIQPGIIKSPRSPASIKRIPSTDDLLLVWNNTYDYAQRLGGNRTPLNIAVSKNSGATWENTKTIEDDPDGWYCYTAIEFTDDTILLAYCAGSQKGKSQKLATTQVTRVSLDLLYKKYLSKR